MNIITGYISATDGTVKIDGHDIADEPAAAKACIGYLPELPPLYQEMTVQEYLLFVAELKGTRKRRIVPPQWRTPRPARACRAWSSA